MPKEVFSDHTLVSVKELPAALHVSRSTVFNWKAAGYVFAYGRMTTPGHCKAWLRERAGARRSILEESGVESMAAHAGPASSRHQQSAEKYFRLFFATHPE
jgi:hypothetical protein